MPTPPPHPQEKENEERSQREREREPTDEPQTSRLSDMGESTPVESLATSHESRRWGPKGRGEKKGNLKRVID